jgi:hypothetical protein
MFKLHLFALSFTFVKMCMNFILFYFVWLASSFVLPTWVMSLVEYDNQFVRNLMWSISFYFSIIFFLSSCIFIEIIMMWMRNWQLSFAHKIMLSNPIHVQGVPLVFGSIIVSIHGSCLKGKKKLIHPQTKN